MLTIIVGCALSVLWIVSTIRRNNKSSLSKIPNAHFSAPYSNLWLRLLTLRGIEHRSRVQIHRRLGPVVRIGPNDVSVNCIDDGVRIIYSSKFDKDPVFYNSMVDQYVSSNSRAEAAEPILIQYSTRFMVTMVGNDEHRKRKRMMAWPYSNSYILNSQNLDNVLLRVTRELQEGMADWAITGVSVNVFQKAKCCMLDVASGWLFGSENATNTLRDSSFQDYLTDLARFGSKTLVVRTTLLRPLASFAQWAYNTVPSVSLMSRFQEWLTLMITESRKQHATKPSSTKSLYDYFYDSYKKTNPDMTFNEIASAMAAELDDHVAATHFGLGITLSYAMYELSRDPNSQRALRQELLTIAEPSRQPLAHRLANLPVLDAVVTETLRTRAPCPGPFPRVVPESGCRLVGKFDIPGGTVVSSTAWALHFNPEPFPSPDEWRPARWLEADEQKDAEMRKWIWTFGSGARVCIGTHFSSRVVKELLFAIYTDYETSLDEEFSGSVDQEDAFSAGPSSYCLPLKFRRVTQPSM